MAVSKVTVHFPCPVERVWHTVTDLTHTAWRSDLARVEVLDEGRFVEHTKSGYATNFAVASSAIKHTIHGDANITDDVSTIRNLMNMNYDIKR